MGTADGAQGEVRVADATLWQPGAAYLYDLDARGRSTDGEVVDSTRCRSASARSRCAAPSSSSTAPVLLHGLRQARGQRRPRQGPRRRLPRARLPAHGLDRRELVPHLALPLRRGGHGVRRPARHRRDRRDAGRRPEPGPPGGITGAPKLDLRPNDRRRRPGRARPGRANSSPATRTTPASSSGRSRTNPPRTRRAPASTSSRSCS